MQGQKYPGKSITFTPDSTYATRNPVAYQSARVISASEISIIRANGSDAFLYIHGTHSDNSNRDTILWAEGTAASYAAQSGQHVLLTPVDTTKPAFYLNADLFVDVKDTSGGNSMLRYGTEQAAYEAIQVTGTAAAIKALFDAALPSDAANVITVAVAGTNQGTATEVTGLVNGAENLLVITGADNTGGVRIPAATAGMAFDVVATGSGIGAFALIYPTGAETIRGQGTWKVSEGNAFRIVCFVDGTWAVDSASRHTLTVAVSAVPGTGFTVQSGENNTVIITGANGTDAIQLTTDPSENTLIKFVNASASVALVKPRNGANFGFGADVPLKLQGYSTASYLATSAGTAFQQTFGTVYVQGEVVLVEQANTGTTGLENGAVNTVNIVGGGTTLSSASPSKRTDLVPVEHYTASIELSATPANNVIAAQSIIVASVTAPTDVIVIDSNLVNRVRVLNTLGLVFIVRFSSDTAVTFGSINGVASASYVVNASARVLDFEANGGYPGPYTAYSLLSCHGQGQFDGATGTDVIADIGIRATSSVMITRTSVPSAANVISEFVTKAAGTGFTVTSYDAAYATVLTDAGTFDYYVRY